MVQLEKNFGGGGTLIQYVSSGVRREGVLWPRRYYGGGGVTTP